MIIKPRSRAARREQREKLGWCSKQTKMFKTFQILAASVNRIKHTTRILGTSYYRHDAWKRFV